MMKRHNLRCPRCKRFLPGVGSGPYCFEGSTKYNSYMTDYGLRAYCLGCADWMLARDGNEAFTGKDLTNKDLKNVMTTHPVIKYKYGKDGVFYGITSSVYSGPCNRPEANTPQIRLTVNSHGVKLFKRIVSSVWFWFCIMMATAGIGGMLVRLYEEAHGR